MGLCRALAARSAVSLAGLLFTGRLAAVRRRKSERCLGQLLSGLSASAAAGTGACMQGPFGSLHATWWCCSRHTNNL